MIKRITIIAFILIAVGIIGGLFSFQSIHDPKNLTDEKIEIEDSFDTIDISSNEARIEVLPTDETKAWVELTGKKSNHHLQVDVTNKKLTVQVENKQRKLFNFDFTAALLSLKIYVPEKAYEALNIESENGRVQVEQLLIKDVHVETDNGHITLEGMNSSSIDAEADNGTIELRHVVADEVTAVTTNGKISLDDVEGNLIGRTNNGAITLITEELNRPIDFQTDNGRITIQTDKQPTNAMLDLKVQNGNIKVFGESNWDTIIGNGEHLIKLTTDNGSISIS